MTNRLSTGQWDGRSRPSCPNLVALVTEQAIFGIGVAGRDVALTGHAILVVEDEPLIFARTAGKSRPRLVRGFFSPLQSRSARGSPPLSIKQRLRRHDAHLFVGRIVWLGCVEFVEQLQRPFHPGDDRESTFRIATCLGDALRVDAALVQSLHGSSDAQINLLGHQVRC